MSLFRTKPVEHSLGATEDVADSGHRLSRELSALDLTVFGIGVIVGTGIFVLTGQVARENAGPAVALSFVAAGIACALAALCYAELSSTVPVAGSAYTFSYATIGEFPAWVIGWDLILELALGAAVVAVGWSGYAQSLLDTMGLHLPSSIAGEQATFNIPAMLIVLLVTALLVLGIKVSSRVNAAIVTIKIAVVLLVIVAGLFFIKGANYHPFIPQQQSGPDVSGAKAPLIQALFGITPVNFGWLGVFAAAAIVFFAFIGFDIVATAAEETRRPQRDLPIGIIGSLAVCTILYVAVSLVVVGMQNYKELSTEAPLADAFKAVGHPVFATIISVGALAGLTTVVLILMLGQTRVFFAMSRDRLMPPWLAAIHPRFRTPYRITIMLGVIVSIVAALIPLSALAELVNIGTLFAFVVVSIAVIVLRRTRPDLPRSFRTPLVPVLPVLSVLASLYLMLNLPVETWVRFGVWMIVGAVFFFLYGRRNSHLGATAPPAPPVVRAE
ncbi:MAG TPA: amino acid permease [Streptosporangiaceae bacterium]|nr:amino acid permease [Streptosporangiaceae bacterium]